MDTILFKYHCNGDDFLVLDTCKNTIALDARAVRMICTRNFGFGSAGILAGALTDAGKMSLKQYLPDGSETKATSLGAKVFGKYLLDAGYFTGSSEEMQAGLDEKGMSLGTGASREAETSEDQAEEVGKLFLSEAFLSRNHVNCHVAGVA